MPTFTVSIPTDLKEKIDRHPEINWPEYLKQKFGVRINELKKFKKSRRNLNAVQLRLAAKPLRK
ncbi:MAG TPA: hypothetical protein HA224_01405 [Nanoarchaeota archaeon]|nr:hypothetical protein [Nanoarchaeota archaeon]